MLLQSSFEKAFSIYRFLNCDSDILFYTGFKCYHTLYAVYEFFTEDALVMYYLGSRYSKQDEVGVQSDKRGRPRKLLKLDEFFMTLIRLRKGYEEVHLGHLFGISQSQVSRITNTWILLMAKKLSQVDFWPKEPPKEQLIVPPELRDELKDVIAIVDATEIFTQKPSASMAQKEIFSNYKNHVTAKFIVAIDCNGTIIFHSRAYAGRVSDKKMFLHCGITDLIREGQTVMVDRGT
jgi:hypothetical protein